MNGSVDFVQRWGCHTRLEKYETSHEALGISEDEWARFVLHHHIVPVEVIEREGNVLTTLGINRMLNLLTAQGSTTPLSNANARLAVGDSSTAVLPGDTDLNAGANKFRKGMRSAGFPSVPAAGAVQFSSDFTGAEANYAWNEWGVTDSASGGLLFNHKAEGLGTKGVGTTWTLTVTISIA